MKTLIAILALTWICPLDVLGDERSRPIDAQLPKIGSDWVRRGDNGEVGDYSWVNFENKDNSSEVLSFVAYKVCTGSA